LRFDVGRSLITVTDLRPEDALQRDDLSAVPFRHLALALNGFQRNASLEPVKTGPARLLAPIFPALEIGRCPSAACVTDLVSGGAEVSPQNPL
jgi:hypothetical protein